MLTSTVIAQNTVDVRSLSPNEYYENIYVKQLYSDTNCTSFLIWVKNGVKSHKHQTHTENIQIIEGEGIMTVGNEVFPIKPSDFFVIPQNTLHSVKVTSSTPLKLISIQTPQFNGDDRVFEHD